jgi:hypothetical protein
VNIDWDWLLMNEVHRLGVGYPFVMRFFFHALIISDRFFRSNIFLIRIFPYCNSFFVLYYIWCQGLAGILPMALIAAWWRLSGMTVMTVSLPVSGIFRLQQLFQDMARFNSRRACTVSVAANPVGRDCHRERIPFWHNLLVCWSRDVSTHQGLIRSRSDNVYYVKLRFARPKWGNWARFPA